MQERHTAALLDSGVRRLAALESGIGDVPSNLLELAVLVAAAIPFIFYLLTIYSSSRYFWQNKKQPPKNLDFTPPVSNLKPVRGLDPEAYENFVSFCRQDYPEYELIFCVTDQTDPSVPVIQRLIREFPEKKIRLLYFTDEYKRWEAEHT